MSRESRSEQNIDVFLWSRRSRIVFVCYTCNVAFDFEIDESWICCFAREISSENSFCRKVNAFRGKLIAHRFAHFLTRVFWFFVCETMRISVSSLDINVAIFTDLCCVIAQIRRTVVLSPLFTLYYQISASTTYGKMQS